MKKNSKGPNRWLLSERLTLLIPGILFIPAIVLGVYGYCHYPIGDESTSVGNALYHTAQLFIMHAPHFAGSVPWTLEVARWMAAASTLLVLLNAALRLFHNELLEYKRWRMENHIVVCGLGRRGIAVVIKLAHSGQKVIAVDRDPEPEINERLHNLRIPLIIGDASNPDILRRARVEFADKIYVLCPEDAINFSIAMAAHNFECSKKKKAKYISAGNGTALENPRDCYIHVNDTELRSALQNNFKKLGTFCPQKNQFIDAFGQEAIALLARGLPLDHDGIGSDDTMQVHLIILGFGCMGRTIAVNAAQLGAFANRKKIRISVIDRKATVTRSHLLFHHQYIESVADFSFYEQEALSPETRGLIEKWCAESDMLVNVVICFDNPPVAYDTAFNLLPFFNRKNVRVAVRADVTECCAFLLNNTDERKYEYLNIRAFGVEKSFENLINPEQDETEKFAMDIHRAYSEFIKLTEIPDKAEKRMASAEMQPWAFLSEDLKESNRQQAVHILIKIRAAGFEIVDEADARPAIEEFEKQLLEDLSIMEHDRWLAERRVGNWTFGDTDDRLHRISKNLVDWSKLDGATKEFDYDAVRRIPALLRSISKKIIKT